MRVLAVGRRTITRLEQTFDLDVLWIELEERQARSGSKRRMACRWKQISGALGV